MKKLFLMLTLVSMMCLTLSSCSDGIIVTSTAGYGYPSYTVYPVHVQTYVYGNTWRRPLPPPRHHKPLPPLRHRR